MSTRVPLRLARLSSLLAATLLATACVSAAPAASTLIAATPTPTASLITRTASPAATPAPTPTPLEPAGGLLPAIPRDIYFTGGQSCPASTYLVGLLMIDRTTQPNKLVVQDDRGDKTSITWRGWGYTFRMTGDEVEVVDGGTVVATSGRRYAIGGRHEAAFHGFWACAGDVKPA